MAIGRSGSDIEVGEGSLRVPGYRVHPVGGRGRGVLVLGDDPDHGLARDACDRLAREGFVALALALEGLGPGRGGEEGEWALLDAGIDTLLRDDATDGARIGVLGFGVGGGRALTASGRSARVGAVVVFDGAVPEALDAGSIGASVLALVGASEGASPQTATELEARLREAGGRALVRVRAGVSSGYMDPSRADDHDAAAAAEGWDALVAFFQAEL